MCSAPLVNCAFDQTRCAADQFTNCAEFHELRNIWSTAQRTCNAVRVTVKVRTRISVRARFSFRVGVRLVLALGLCNWPNAQRI